MTGVLAVSGLSVRRGARAILEGVDLAADRREVVAVMGLSGAGKTTLLRAVAGLDPFDAGSIRVEDATLAPGRPDARQLARVRRRLGLVFQAHALFDHLTARENVALALVHVQRWPQARASAEAEALLERLGVGDRRDARPRELSGGEAQRVAIARALALDPPLLLLDEPTASLDPARRLDVGRRLGTLAAGGRALVFTSHDQAFVRVHATRVLVLAAGHVVEAGPPAEVLGRPCHPATRALLHHDAG
jgi:ABC-type polar amino acid transport system ATPase subunit